MKINWKVRFKNGTWLTTFILLCVTFVYNVLGMLEIVPPISEETLTSAVLAVINVLVALGVVVDPTTKGITDSDRAMSYTEPAE